MFLRKTYYTPRILGRDQRGIIKRRTSIIPDRVSSSDTPSSKKKERGSLEKEYQCS